MKMKKRTLYDEEGWGLNAGVYLMRGGPIEWFDAQDVPKADRMRIKWKRMITHTGVEPAVYEKLFGKRTQTFSDSEGRRLAMWRLTHRVGERDILFWLSAHKHRGSSLEVQKDATPQETLAVIQFVHGKIEEAGLLPDAALMDFNEKVSN